MYHSFLSTTQKLSFHHEHNWHIWSATESMNTLISCLINKTGISQSNILKEEKHKLVYKAGANNELAIKWQKYRDPRRLWKANYFRNQRLTRNEGGMLRTEWMNNCFLDESRVPVAKPIGFAEKRIAGVIIEQAMICENLNEAKRLKDYIDNLPSIDEKTSWLKKGIDLAYTLHEHACYHLDFHHRNILFVNSNPFLIDNEKVIHFSQPRDELLAMMLGRLGFSLRANPSEYQFFKSYGKPTNHTTLFEDAYFGKLSGDKLTQLINQ